MFVFPEQWQDVRGDETVFQVVSHGHVIPLMKFPDGVHVLLVRKRNNRLQKRTGPLAVIQEGELIAAITLRKQYVARTLF